MTSEPKSIHLHIICERDVGLFSLMQQVIAQLPWALSEERVPIVHFGRFCSYWTPSGYAGKHNVWEYYFEPIVAGFDSDYLPDDIIKQLDSSYLDGPPYVDLGAGSIASNHFGDHPLLGSTLKIPYGWADPSLKLRLRASQLIESFVRPRAYIKQKTEAFHSQNMAGRFVIGVHARGTDSLTEVNKTFRHGSLVLANYKAAIDSLLQKEPHARILVATDEEATLSFFKGAFGDRVVAYDAVRHQSSQRPDGTGPMGWCMPAYIASDRDLAARNGEEAVVEYSLLSRSDFLFHNGSSLARTVLLHNPSLRHSNVHLDSTKWWTRTKERLRRRLKPLAGNLGLPGTFRL